MKPIRKYFSTPLLPLLLVTILSFSHNVQASEETDQTSQKLPDELRVRTTAYTHTEADHLVHGTKTAAGTKLISGKVNSAAADWSFMPLGTKFRIKGESTIYHVEDYGRALVGTRTVDIYRPTKSSMNTWGVRFVEIEIIEEGCPIESIRLLKSRTHAAHCRQMLKRLREEHI